MPDPVITNLDIGPLILEGEAVFRDESLTLAGADTLLPGTILARDSVSHLLVLFVVGGVTNGNGVGKAVVTHPVVAAGAGNHPVRVLAKGNVNQSRLVVDAAGDASTITGTIVDQLRAVGITPVNNVKQLVGHDNPA